jgi:hypothetical protein
MNFRSLVLSVGCVRRRVCIADPVAAMYTRAFNRGFKDESLVKGGVVHDAKGGGPDFVPELLGGSR